MEDKNIYVVLFIISLNCLTQFGKGDALDITLVIKHPLIGPTSLENQTFTVYLGAEETLAQESIQFQRRLELLKSSQTGDLAEISTTTQLAPGIIQLQFTQADSTLEGIGPFEIIATPSDGNKTTITSVVMLSTATIVPVHTTQTINQGENVTLSFTTEVSNLRWRFDNSKTNYKNVKSITLEEVSFGDEGIYECFENNQRSNGTHGFMALLIRRCPANLWGTCCDQDCPLCLNGGMCDADSGLCVCRPGFSGLFCENVLGRNRFGQDGSHSCDSTGDAHSPGCKGMLFCLPDPLGCTCAAGYMGVDCMNECELGYYGANCNQMCKCSPSNDCSKDTGECLNENTCEDGWTGVNCQISSNGLPATPPYSIVAFNYTKANPGQPTLLECTVSGEPTLLQENVNVFSINTLENATLINSSIECARATFVFEISLTASESPQHFSCLISTQDGMNVSNNISVSVYELPRLQSAPRARTLASDTIEVSWDEWAAGSDTGDGPVIGYRVYYNTYYSTVQRTSEELIQATSVNVSKLTHDTTYEFAVTAVREGQGGEGDYSLSANNRTKCSAPTATPSVTLDVDSTDIVFTWTPPTDASSGCSSGSSLQVSIKVFTSYDDTIHSAHLFDASLGSGTISSLSLCTEYQFHTAYTNKDEDGSIGDILMASTPSLVPESPQIISSIPGEAHVTLSWEIPSTSCPPDSVIISYILHKNKACQSPAIQLQEGTEERTSNTSFTIVGLEPYSTYNISLSAVNDAGESGGVDIMEDTLESAPAAVSNLKVDPSVTGPTSIGFTWDSLTCHDVNGRFWYYYAVLYKDGAKLGSSTIRERLLDQQISSVQFSNLDACTMYELHINAANKGDYGAVSGSLATTNATTEIQFSNTAVLATEARQLFVTWSIPEECDDRIQFYQLTYQRVRIQACSQESVSAIQIEQTVYKNISLSDLEDFATYNISIAAVVNGAFSSMEYESGTTQDASPEQISVVSFTSTTESLTFTWDPLPCQDIHGDFHQYEYCLTDEHSNETVESGSTNNTFLTFSALYPCAYYTFKVRIVTIQGKAGYWTHLTGHTNMGAPEAVEKLTSVRTSRQIQLSWELPQISCPANKFIVTYGLYNKKACSNAESNAVQNELVVSSENCTLEDLDPYSKYDISVVAVNEEGYSGASYKSVATQADAPPAMTGLETDSSIVEPTRIGFTWDSLTCENVNGLFFYYSARLFEGLSANDTLVNQSSIMEQDTTSVVFSFLHPCTTYELLLAAVNNGGDLHLVGDDVSAQATTGVAPPGEPNITLITPFRNDIIGAIVTWEGPATPCQPTHFNVYYTLLLEDMCIEHPSDDVILAGTGDSSTLMFRVEGLRPYTKYNISVIADNSAGSSPPDTEEVITDYSVPSGPPTKVETKTSKKRTLAFTWEEPACGDRNGPITSYACSLLDMNGIEISSQNISSSEDNEATFDGLTPYTNYTFTVRAANYDLVSDSEASLVQQTDEAKPAAPINVEVPASDQSSITVEWQSPNPPEGRIIRYYVIYWDTAGDVTRSNDSIECTHGLCDDLEHTFSHTISDLKADTNYSIQVRAESKVGVGDKSPENPATKITSEGKPSEPVEIRISEHTSSSLTVAWDEPHYPNGEIVEYKVAYKANQKTHDTSYRPADAFSSNEVSGAILTIGLTDLEPATLYEIYVVARTSKGWGESSERIEQWTNPPSTDDIPAPDPPAINLVDTSPTIEFVKIEYAYYTHMLVRVDRVFPAPVRRKRASDLGSYNENPDLYIAGRVQKDDLPYEFSIGDNTTDADGYYNAPLQNGVEYEIRTGVQSDNGNMNSIAYSSPTLFTPEDPATAGPDIIPVVIGVIFALILAAAVVVIILFIRKKREKDGAYRASLSRARNGRASPRGIKQREQSRGDSVAMRHVNTLEREGAGANRPSYDALCDREESPGGGAIYANYDQTETQRGPVPLDELVQYVAEKKASLTDNFRQEYESIPGGQLYPWEVAKKPENKQKNRYVNIISYDHSRVPLTLLDNDPNSDYINACFIDGYNYPRKFIASQGPNIASVKDFWRMVWEYDCGKIVMLTNLVEGEKKKCEKYWPDKKMLYGRVTVARKSEEKNTHYTVRIFSVQFEEEIRELTQFHFTTWPDMGVPQYTAPLMNFIRTTKLHQTPRTGPTIVHCSAGVGRTGTFITLDAMLDQSEAASVIDVYSFVTQMRQNRIKMVQVSEQYEFVFDALLETFTCGDTSIPQDVYLQRYSSLMAPSPDTGSTILQEQFERLELFTIKPRPDELRAARNQANTSKNRYQDKVTTDKSRPYLITEVDDRTNYVNASFLSGYTKKDKFIGTQTPLPNTVVDFWRLVFDYKICTIVMLNGCASEDQSMVQYWPHTVQGELSVGPFNITLLSEEYYDEIACRTLELRSTTSKSRVQTIYQLQLQTWPMELEISASITSVIELHRQAVLWNDANASDTPILVHCKDGEGVTGTFCALSSVMERLSAELLVDVFQACKRLRAIRPTAVATQAQYEFIHLVMRLYLDSYDIYENYR